MTAVPLKRILQLPAFCGPATLSMLLSQYSIDIDQQKVGLYADALDRLEEYGTRIDELALAVRRIDPNLSMWAKRDATLEDIDVLINTHTLAVGVEWQGDIFFRGDDAGHYSAVIGINLEKKTILIRDPEYKDRDRKFRFKTFLKRWYDTNIVGADAPEEAKEWMDDYHVIFVVAPKDRIELEKLGLKKVRISSSTVLLSKHAEAQLVIENTIEDATRKTPSLAVI